jgi:site-specific recombinase XerD
VTSNEARTRDLATLVVPRVGRLAETGDRWEPYRLLDPAGELVPEVAVYFEDLQAASRSASTLRSYGMDLLRWYRFVWAIAVPWDRATRVEARDFSRWLQRPARAKRGGSQAVGEYQASTRAHSETVLRNFYELHRELGGGPVLNPFPLARGRRGGRAHAHHNPMEPFRHERAGLYRPKVPTRIPRSIPDEEFNAAFAALPTHRDRALVAFYISTGVRASELLGMAQGDVDVGRQLITVVRKGTRAIQQVPASPDAFVWLRLYQEQILGVIPRGRREPLWRTLRRPFRPLTYHGAHRMFERVVDGLGKDWTLHALRHTAAYRMARDPDMPLTDVQWVLGHAQLSSTQIYTTPHPDDVIHTVLAHHARQAATPPTQPAPPAPGYRMESLDVLFGRDR